MHSSAAFRHSRALRPHSGNENFTAANFDVGSVATLFGISLPDHCCGGLHLPSVRLYLSRARLGGLRHDIIGIGTSNRRARHAGYWWRDHGSVTQYSRTDDHYVVLGAVRRTRYGRAGTSELSPNAVGDVADWPGGPQSAARRSVRSRRSQHLGYFRACHSDDSQCRAMPSLCACLW